MPSRRRSNLPPADSTAVPKNGHGIDGGLSLPAASPDWSAFLRRMERKRRLLLTRNGAGPLEAATADYCIRATHASFRLEGLDVTLDETRDALTPAPAPERPILRSRQSQRLRNHAAILHHLENDLRQGVPLTSDGVVRWYVTISAGLSTTSLDQAAIVRVDDVVHRINSPQMRLQAALHEVAAIHLRLLADPLVPSFNGILARLLLRYHLGRCNLPAIVFDPVVDARYSGIENLMRRLVELLNQSYDDLLRQAQH